MMHYVNFPGFPGYPAGKNSAVPFPGYVSRFPDFGNSNSDIPVGYASSIKYTTQGKECSLYIWQSFGCIKFTRIEFISGANVVSHTPLRCSFIQENCGISDDDIYTFYAYLSRVVD